MFVKSNYKMIAVVCIVFLLTISLLVYKNRSDNSRQAFSASDDGIKLPILIYHSILKTKNTMDDHIISPSDLENDLKYIKQNGYTTIIMEDLIGYFYNNKELPEKPIMITFDDGYYNNFVYALPLIKKYQMRAVFSIIGTYTDAFSKKDSDNLEYSHMTWDQVNETLRSGCFEIQNHSYNLHTASHIRAGMKINKGEPLEHYEEVLKADVSKFQEQIKEMTGYTPSTLTYPFGYISKESIEILKKMGFKASLSTYGGINIIKKDPSILFGLKRNNRPHGISSKTFFKNIYK